MAKSFPRGLCLAAASVLLSLAAGGCLMLHPTHTNPLANLPSNQPDKVLFDRARGSMDHGKYTVARLTLETLLNTYPESEYQAQAKLAIADSWYREGGSEGMAQAEAQYKDFITFFPTLTEASYAQFRIATIHFNQVQKPDRDRTEAERAQDELRTFVANYPTSPYHDQAMQMLRETQEVLGDSEFRIATFYRDRTDACQTCAWAEQERLTELLANYPLYSRGDEAEWMLAENYRQSAINYETHLAGRPDPQKPLYTQQTATDRAKAAEAYQRVIERYPASPLVAQAKKALESMHASVPIPDPAEVAFNRSEIAGRVEPNRNQRYTGALRTKPIATEDHADHVGMPLLVAGQTVTDAEVRGTPTAAGTTATAALDAPKGDIGAGFGGFQMQNLGSNSASGFTNVNTTTPNAVVETNANDPNASHAATPADPVAKDLSALSPDEIDNQEKLAVLQSEVSRNIPPKEKNKNVAAGPDPNAAKAPKKSLLGRLWP